MRVRLLNQYMQLSLLVLAFAEAAGFFMAPVLAALVRFDWSFSKVKEELDYVFEFACLFSTLVMVSAVAMGLYSARQRARIEGVLLRMVSSICVATASMLILFYFFSSLRVGRGVVGLAVMFAVIIGTVLRLSFERVRDESFIKRRVLIVGTGKQAMSILRLRRRTDQRGFFAVGFIRVDDGMDIPPDKVLGNQDDLVKVVKDLEVDEIVVALDDRRKGFPIAELLECRFGGVQVTDLLCFLERETGKVRLDLLNPSWMIFGDGFDRTLLRRSFERLFDLVACVLILFPTWPLMLLTALAIKVEDGWRAPVLYRQVRVGMSGRKFNILKFRSMRVDAESGQAIWAKENDPRVTRIGAFSRATRLDELPQIFNVLLGHMRFVGPRPERPEFVKQLSEKIPYYAERHSVKPGITGWAQLCYQYGASEADAVEKLQYDLYYVKNSSFLFDLGIFLQTVETVLWRKGSR